MICEFNIIDGLVIIDGVGGFILLILFEVNYGLIDVLGFWFNDIVYLFDVVIILDEVWGYLGELWCWIVDVLCCDLYLIYLYLE